MIEDRNSSIKADFGVSDMKEILESYSVFRKLLDMYKYNNEYFGNAEILAKKQDEKVYGDAVGETFLASAMMFDIRRFVLSLSSGNEKLFLFYHYIHGLSVGRIAELMGISRRSAFRMKQRAIEYAALRYPIYLAQAKNGIK